MSDIYVTPTTPEEENVAPTTGECRYCRQILSVYDVPPIGDFKDNFVAANEQATLCCTCDSALDYQQYIKVIDQVEQLFDDEDIVVYIKELAIKVHDEFVQSVTIQIDPVTKVTINRTTKNKIKIKRTSTETQNIEA